MSQTYEHSVEGGETSNYVNGYGSNQFAPVYMQNTNTQQPANYQTRERFESALDFLDKVKKVFSDNPQTYTQFLEIMRAFKSHSIDTPGVILGVKRLFHGHRDLILGFNSFLPIGYKITSADLDDPPAGNNDVGGAVAVAPQANTGNNRAPPSLGNNNNNNNNNKQPNNNNNPPPNAAPNTNPQHVKPEFEYARNYVKRIKVRFASEPHIYRSFLEILHTFHKQQQSITEVYSSVSKLFRKHKDLLKEFSNFLPDVKGIIPPEDEPEIKQEPIEEPPKKSRRTNLNPTPRRATRASTRGNNNKLLPTTSTPERTVVAAPGSTNVSPTSVQAPSTPASLVSNPPVPQMQVIPIIPASFTELEQFVLIKFTLGPERWRDFLKCMELFNMEIISKYEVLLLSRELLIDQLDLWHRLREFMKFDRDSFPEEDDLAVGDLDLTECERNGVSYRMIPKGFKFKPCSGRTKLCDEVLNDIWISRPTGEEGASFKSSRKNEYEELLFKCEDDRFEWDLIVEKNCSAIRQLEMIQRHILSLPKEKQGDYKISTLELDSLSRNSIRQIYGQRGHEVEKALLDNPISVVPIVLARLKQKDHEWAIAKQQWLLRWRRVFEDNYHKSLDHESAYFKQDQKKKLNPHDMMNECKHKYLLKKQSIHSSSSVVLSPDDCDYESEFKDKQIFEDVLLLIHQLSDRMLNVDEQQKLKKILIPVIHEYFSPALTNSSQFVVSNVPIDPETDSLCKPTFPQTAIQLKTCYTITDQQNQTTTQPTQSDQTENNNNTDNMQIESSNTNQTQPVVTENESNKQFNENQVTDPSTSPTISSTSSSTSTSLSSFPTNTSNKDTNSAQDTNSVQQKSVNNIFYADGSFFVFFRYFQILYTRLEQAKSLSEKPYENIVFVPPTHLPREKKELPLKTPDANRERYRHFLQNLNKLIYNHLEQSTFEDECRETFGVSSYTLFSMDRLLLCLGKHLSTMLYDDTVSKLAGIYLYESRRGFDECSEQIYFSNIEGLINCKKRYRIVFNHQTSKFSITQLDFGWCPEGLSPVKSLSFENISGKLIINNNQSNSINNVTTTWGGQNAGNNVNFMEDPEFISRHNTPYSQNIVHPDWQSFCRQLVDSNQLPTETGDVFLKRNRKLVESELGDYVMNDTIAVNTLLTSIDTMVCNKQSKHTNFCRP
eukprot:TRINITY_DN2843_c1_g1_i2.p1 TRINITY_DN2843_c1_g1~~TRINITY_DN2843_c1_g1_i2.p1  ORF type:complete len:1171 (+),score=266.98 TRINITY_DN2843_c1_g1_i2:46-3558(+)